MKTHRLPQSGLICVLILLVIGTVFGESPQLGNATRNGWIDQSSAVIWTRTTRASDMRLDGPTFKNVPAKLETEIRNSGDMGRYLSDQIPGGVTLDEMFGACPGAPGHVRLSYHPMGQSELRITTDWKITQASEDFTAQWSIDGLLAGTEYLTIVEAKPLGSKIVSATIQGRFITASSADSKSNVRFCMTTCHDFLRRDEGELGHKIYPSMTSLNPDFVVHAGDIEYYDKPKPWAWTKELMRFKWARIFSMPRNREFYAKHTTYFIKDDHDTLKNDSWPGQVYGEVTFDEGVQLFNDEQFPSKNPRYQTISWGKDLQFWLLEGRDYRSSNRMPDGANKTILGADQKAWLKQTLLASSASFKLVFSPTPIVGPDRVNKKDNHANTIFAHEGNELRKFFSTIEGILLFCGDRHWQYASVDAETGLWEFGCGPGSEKHQFGWKKGDVRPVHRFLRVDGGFLSGEIHHDKGNAQLTLRHHAVDGSEQSRFNFPE